MAISGRSGLGAVSTGAGGGSGGGVGAERRTDPGGGGATTGGEGSTGAGPAAAVTGAGSARLASAAPAPAAEVMGGGSSTGVATAGSSEGASLSGGVRSGAGRTSVGAELASVGLGALVAVATRDRLGALARRLLGLLARVLGLLAHSGGSSSKTRFQIRVAARVVATVARAPIPASRPDQSSRLISGLSVIVSGIQSDLEVAIGVSGRRSPPSYPSSPLQIISTIKVLARSSSLSLIASLSKIQPVSTCSTEP